MDGPRGRPDVQAGDSGQRCPPGALRGPDAGEQADEQRHLARPDPRGGGRDRVVRAEPERAAAGLRRRAGGRGQRQLL